MDFQLGGTAIKSGSAEWLLLNDVHIEGFGTGLAAQGGFTVNGGTWANGTNIIYSGNIVGRVERYEPQWVRHEDIVITSPTWGPDSTKNIDLPALEYPHRFRNYAWQQNVIYIDGDGNKHLLYRPGQEAEAVIPEFLDSRTFIAPGMTNQQMYDNYRMSYFSRIIPDDAEFNLQLGWHSLVSDTTPPYASSTTSERLPDGRLAVRWSTDEPATSQVEWVAGSLQTTTWGNFTPLDSELKTEHEVIFDAPMGRITFMRYSADAEGNIRQDYRVGGFDRRAFTHKD
jgi:hypothetical protein